MAKFWKMFCYVLFNKVIAFFYYLGEDWGSGGIEKMEEWRNGGMSLV